jgi:hypothetical protein
MSQWEEDRDLVEELCAIEDGLSDWEVEFVESISKWVLEEKRVLTARQRETAERIAGEKG